MKYKITIFIFFTIITINLNSQTFVYNIPKEVKYITEKDTAGYPNNLYANFLPIGWSKSGKFAYVLEPADEACGCYFFELHIFDAITSKEWFTWRYSDEGKGEKSGTSTIDTVWAQKKKFFYKKLIQAGIGQQKDIKIQNLYSSKITFKENVQNFESVDFGTMVKDYTLYAKQKNNNNKNTLGKKVYYKKYATWEKDRKIWTSYIINASTIGYIKSPFTNQNILIHKLVQRGWEGTPYVVSLEVSGYKEVLE